MRKIVYGCACSLDGFIAREDEGVDWLLWGPEVNEIMARWILWFGDDARIRLDSEKQ
mgnify:CR=1 FL=1